MKKTTKNSLCPECGGEIQITHYTHIEYVGNATNNYQVVDSSKKLPQCTKCGNVDLTLKQLQSYQLQAASIFLERSPVITPSMIKYSRKALAFSPLELSDILQQPESLIYSWEYEIGSITIHTRLELLALVQIAIKKKMTGLRLQKHLCWSQKYGL
jgi:hypothetical protein